MFEGTPLVPRVALDAVPLAVRAGDAATLAGQGPGAFAAANHEHAGYATTTDLTDALAGTYDKATCDARFAPLVHGHAWGGITGKPTAFPPEPHTHGDLYYSKTDVDGSLVTTEARLYCLEHCNPATHETCKALVCNGTSQTCTAGANLPDGTACIDGGRPGRCAAGTCCTPATCSDLGATCGLLDDLCGGLLACGNCTAPAICQGTACCTPKTCADLGKTCSTHADGCGGSTSDCGACRVDQACVSGACGCATVTCGDPAEPAGEYCCPALEGYAITCNAQQHCEYANVDPTGWKQHDVWVYVPPGTYPIGSPASEAGHAATEGPWHTVAFERGFLFGKFEATVLQYEACTSAGNCTAASVADDGGDGWGLNTGRDLHPQNGLTWSQAGDVCAWMAPGGRRPSEAEWEAAASGPTHRRYPWGDSPEPTCANGTAVFYETANGCGSGGTAEVGSKPTGASWSGAYDVAGNVWEWNEDYPHGDYSGAPDDGGAWVSPASGNRVLRGGGFGSSAGALRSSNRNNTIPSHRSAGTGARCVRPLPATSCTWHEDGTGTPHVDACPILAGYTPYCNRQGHCEYSNNDRTGWKAWDVWIWVAPGSFWMGSPASEAGHEADEELVHEVTFATGYFIGKYEVTTAIYAACHLASSGTCSAPDTAGWDGLGWGTNTAAGGRSDHPQNGLTWGQSGAVCAWLGGRLSSEAQWEYAASGPTHRVYPWGATPTPTCAANAAVHDDDANGARPWACDSCTTVGCSGTKSVGSMSAGASWSGALDMAGNVIEWCDDFFHTNYSAAPTNGSAWVSWASPYRSVRGGAFFMQASRLRSSDRDYQVPDVHSANTGVRCARDLP